MTSRPVFSRPATASQAAMFYAEQKTASQCAYNVTTVLEVHGTVPDEHLVAGCRRLAERTPALRLRTGLHPDGEVHYWFSSDPLLVDVVALPGADDRAARAAIDDVARLRLTSDGGALARCVVVRTAGDRALVGIVCHHLVVDGATHALLATRLGEAIEDRVEDEPEQSYDALVAAVRVREGQARAEGLDHWSRRLASVADPAWEAGNEVAAAAGGTWLGPLHAGTTARLQTSVGAGADLRMFHLLTAAVRSALPGEPGVPLAIAAATSIRPTPAPARPLTGCFINQVPLVCTSSSGEQLRAAALRQADGWRQDLRRRHVPFADLVARTQQPGRPVVLDRVMLTYRTQPRFLAWRGRRAAYVADLYPRYLEAKTDLTVRFFHHSEEMEVEVQWSDALTSSAARAFSDRLLDTLAAA